MAHQIFSVFYSDHSGYTLTPVPGHEDDAIARRLRKCIDRANAEKYHARVFYTADATEPTRRCLIIETPLDAARPMAAVFPVRPKEAEYVDHCYPEGPNGGHYKYSHPLLPEVPVGQPYPICKEPPYVEPPPAFREWPKEYFEARS